ncbi:enoyl-CoA hydratase [Shewanella sp. Choline-02u-19]|uniref:enoyl-CoA hydratase/isomerase family protein n=1 Tax=unclassified Shewanella TaxID=196818 RepID=UPI000C349AE2|nr:MULTISPECIES: enoyl-CoA hydratase/isomerase family protein [unclassified Shewanella]PKG58602.1 enoyl-CoA hydratase [Shewanella sp. GutDb-MelDb]PKH55763.1 enoyl-CoA hydratase [Shewanella sp. Bg11-22]PKI26823.1 enoyl-CoA hydratase [Shewanella sp. Choline-02u-19]
MATTNANSNSVVFQTLGTASGKHIGVATLNIEKALNALNIEMVQALTSQLTAWRNDNNIVAVVLDGAGEKAFCAGGDVRAIYHAALATPGEVTAQATDFFKQEYQLDYLLHTFAKPVLVWGDGIVMGGGLGLMAGASHRVVTEHSRIAMPEVTIGLYPDVGGSYFLNRMPGKAGLFLGMTAYNMNGADAHYVGIGNHYLNRDDKELLFDAMATLAWADDKAFNHEMLHALIDDMQLDCETPLAPSQLEIHQVLIDDLMDGELTAIVERVSALDDTLKQAQPWLAKACKVMLAGSPISLALVHKQSQLGTQMSLAEVFKFELGLSVNCCARADFAEGVRALLIDKDRSPKWLYKDVASIPSDFVSSLMISPWAESRHPLSDML